MVDAITHFRGNFFFLSNFYPAEVQLEGMTYPTVEHAYQAAKTDNPIKRERIRSTTAPAKAKAYAHDHIAPPSDWNERKVAVMRSLLVQKFSPASPLAVQLVRTGTAALIEHNDWHDTFWGICLCPRHGSGKNQLGLLLMEIRDGLPSDVGLHECETLDCLWNQHKPEEEWRR